MSFERRYVLAQQLGKGGMGVIHRATDRLTGKTVAVKRVTTHLSNLVLATQGVSTSRHRLALTQEFQTLARLRHPNIIRVLDFGFDASQQPYFTMELLEGAQNIIDGGRYLDTKGKVALIVQILEALAYLHRHGLLHRDLKPANVLVVDRQVKLLDFGLAVKEEQRAKNLVGTIAYMAPEIIKGQVASIRSDLFSVGIIAYELFSGIHPYDIRPAVNRASREAGKTATTRDPINIHPISDDLPTVIGDQSIEDSDAIRELSHRVIQESVQTSDTMIDAVIRRLIALEPDDRYPSAAKAIEALLAIVGAERQISQESYLRSARLVGRSEELSRLEDLLSKTINGVGSVWLIGGESGVGKSRLLDELRIRALPERMTITTGVAVQQTASPYQILHEPLRHLVLEIELTRHEARLLQTIVPEIGHILQFDDLTPVNGDVQASQEGLFAAIEEVFRAQPQPTLLMLEDLHWLSDEELSLINRLSGLTRDLPLLILGTFRSDERPDLSKAIDNASLMELARLTPDDVAELSRAIVGSDDASLIRLLNKETEGNALFVVEILRELMEFRGQPLQFSDGTLPERFDAQSVKDVLARRLQRLAGDARMLLQLSAVAGRELDLKLLGYLSGEDVERWLDIAVNAAVINLRDNVWQFTHDKLREAVLEQITELDRKQIHGQIASAIETLYPNVAQQYYAKLVFHWGEAGNSARELEYLIKAGDYALQAGAYQQATSFLERALENEQLTEKQQAFIHQKLGETHYVTGNYEAAATHSETSLNFTRKLGDEAMEASTLRTLGNITQVTGNYELAETYYRESREKFMALGIPLGIARATRELGVLLNSRGRTAESKPLFQESLRTFRDIGDKMGAAGSLTNLGNIDADLGDFALAQQRYEESIALFREINYRWGIAYSSVCLAQAMIQQGQFADALLPLEEAIQLCHSIGHRWGLGFALKNLGDVHLRLDNHEAARTAFRQSLLVAREIDVVPLALYAFPGIADLILQMDTEVKLRRGIGNSLALELYHVVMRHPGSYEESRKVSDIALGKAMDVTQTTRVREARELIDLLITLLAD
ncbi:MAG: tetratricopeptide repeat protein [Chloroflexi bacterium]|nr:tetratricopeptide repeat protein [Chloroflexota bacterium]